MVKCQMKRSFSRGCENILSDLSFTIDFIYWSSLLCPIDFVILEYSFTIIKYKSSSNLQRLLPLMSSYNSFFRAMPPKPWETRSKPLTADVSQIVQSNRMTEAVPTKQLPAGSALIAEMEKSTPTTGLAASSSSSPYSSFGSGYGSSGFGGFGGGMYGGFGGMGMGMGMYGMMGNQDPTSTLSQSLYALQSFGYLISMLGQIGKTLQGNVDGIHRFYQSFKNLCQRGKTFTKQSIFSFFAKLKDSFIRFILFIKQKVFLIGNKNRTTTFKLINMGIRILIVLLAVSLYPVLKKALKPL